MIYLRCIFTQHKEGYVEDLLETILSNVPFFFNTHLTDSYSVNSDFTVLLMFFCFAGIAMSLFGMTEARTQSEFWNALHWAIGLVALVVLLFLFGVAIMFAALLIGMVIAIIILIIVAISRGVLYLIRMDWKKLPDTASDSTSSQQPSSN